MSVSYLPRSPFVLALRSEHGTLREDNVLLNVSTLPHKTHTCKEDPYQDTKKEKERTPEEAGKLLLLLLFYKFL